MTFEKLYNEIYAINLLSRVWKDYKPGFVKYESPDWLCKNSGIGIEVTQALLQYEGEAQKLIDLYLGKSAEAIPKEQLEAFGSRLVFYNGRLQAVLPPEGMKNIGYAFKTLFRFDKKLSKLNSNYLINDKNCLYIFLHTDKELYSEIEFVFHSMQRQQSEKRQRFSYVFLDCEKRLYILDFNSQTIKIEPISEELQKQLSAETEQIKSSYSWDENTAFLGS